MRATEASGIALAKEKGVAVIRLGEAERSAFGDVLQPLAVEWLRENIDAPALVVMAQVVLRYGGVGVPAFTEEVARYAMIWMTLLATSVAVWEGSHIHIDFIPGLVMQYVPRLGAALEWLLSCISLGVFLVLLWQSFDVVAFAYGQKSEGLQIRLAFPYAVMPMAFGAAAVFAAMRLVVKAPAYD